MIVVNRGRASSLIPCWIIKSDLYPDGSTIPIDRTTSTWRTAWGTTPTVSTTSLTRTYTKEILIGGGSFQYFVLNFLAGNSLYKCDQIIFSGASFNNRVPTKFTLNGVSIATALSFNISASSFTNNSGTDFFTVPHDPEYPTNVWRFDTVSSTGSFKFKEVLPVGGTRYYKRAYRNSTFTAFYSDKYGRVPIVLAENQIVSDTRILPDLSHTLTQIDSDNWKATLNVTVGSPKTTHEAYDPRGISHTFATATALIAAHGAFSAAGPYWISYATGKSFISPMDANGRFMVGSSFSDGRTGNMTNTSRIMSQGTNSVLPTIVLATLPIAEVAIESPNVFRIRSTDSIIAGYLKAGNILTQSIADTARWTLDPGNTVAIQLNATSNPPVVPITQRVYHAAGNSNGFHWTCDYAGAAINATLATTSRMQMNILVK